jgi:hypothetical protein
MQGEMVHRLHHRMHSLHPHSIALHCPTSVPGQQISCMYIHLMYVVRYSSIFAHKEGKKVLHTATARCGSATHPIFSRTSSSILAMDSCNGHTRLLVSER